MDTSTRRSGQFPRLVLIVEDDDFMRNLLASYLEKSNFEVAMATNALEAKRAIHDFDPDAVLLDIELGIGPSGLDIADRLTVDRPDIAVVFLTNLSDARFANRNSIDLPPHAAYLNKTMLSDPELVVRALEAVLNERDIREFRHDQLEDRPFSTLSKTQIQVLRLIAEGKTNAQIAKERNRSLAATESLVTRTLKALDIEGNADLNVRVLAARAFLKNGSK